MKSTTTTPLVNEAATHGEAFLRELTVRHYSKSTIVCYRTFLQAFYGYLSHLEGVARLASLERQHVEGFIDYATQLRRKRDGKKWSLETISNLLSVMTTFLRRLHDQEHLEKDLSVFLRRLKPPPAIPKVVLTEKQMERILGAPNRKTPIGCRDFTLLELLYGTGLRRSEAAALTLEDLNFDSKSIRVVQGKGNKDRLVPMGRVTEDALRNYLDWARPRMLKRDAAEVRLFISYSGEPLNARGVQAMVDKYSALTGIEFCAHTLRHAFATHLLKNGASILYIQRILGHENLSTTEIYTRVYPADLKAMVACHHPRYDSGVRVGDLSEPVGRHVKHFKGLHGPGPAQNGDESLKLA